MTLLLGVELLRCLLHVARGDRNAALASSAGLVVALLALTRPERIVYAALCPVLYILVEPNPRVWQRRAMLSAAIPAATWS